MTASKITEQTVRRTFNTADEFGPQDALHAIIGIAGEVGELCDTIKKHLFYGHPIDLENALEEMGDVLYYFTALQIYFGFTPDQIAQRNREKLQARYPDGFTPEAAALKADKVGI